MSKSNQQDWAYGRISDEFKFKKKKRKLGYQPTRLDVEQATKIFLSGGGRITYLEPSHIETHLPDHRDFL